MAASAVRSTEGTDVLGGVMLIEDRPASPVWGYRGWDGEIKGERIWMVGVPRSKVDKAVIVHALS